MLRSRPLATASAVSFLLLLTIAAIWIGTYDLKPARGSVSRLVPDGIPLTNEIRVLAFRGEFSIYNWDIPDRGDITCYGSDPRPGAEFDLAGIYFVELKSTHLFKSGRLWTLTIPFLHLTAVALLLPLVWVISNTRPLFKPPSLRAFDVIVN